MEAKIQLVGLEQFAKALRKIDTEATKELRKTFNASARLLILTTKPQIPVKTGKAAKSLVARSTTRAARVLVGGDRAPYYPWLDFGGKTGIKDSVNRKFYKEGRYIYPTLRRIRPDIETLLTLSIRAVAIHSGMEVENG